MVPSRSSPATAQLGTSAPSTTPCSGKASRSRCWPSWSGCPPPSGPPTCSGRRSRTAPREVAELIGSTEANVRQLTPGTAPCRRGAVTGGRCRPLAAADRRLPGRRSGRGRGRAGGPAGRDVVSRADGGGTVNAPGARCKGGTTWPATWPASSAASRTGPCRCSSRSTAHRGRPHRRRDVARRPGAAHRRRAPDRPRLGGQPGQLAFAERQLSRMRGQPGLSG